MDTVAIKQQLLSQYDTLQSRIKGLKEAAEKEVSTLASCECYVVIFSSGASYMHEAFCVIFFLFIRSCWVDFMIIKTYLISRYLT